MIGGLGPLEMFILVGIFFVLFGAERLPKMANALGRSKGEFQKGLADTSRALDPSKAIEDMEAVDELPNNACSSEPRLLALNPLGWRWANWRRKSKPLRHFPPTNEFIWLA